MENFSLAQLQEQGCPITFSMQIHAPQNGNQRVEHTPVLWRAEVTNGMASIEDIQYHASQAQKQLTQLAEEFTSTELRQQDQRQQQRQIRRTSSG